MKNALWMVGKIFLSLLITFLFFSLGSEIDPYNHKWVTLPFASIHVSHSDVSPVSGVTCNWVSGYHTGWPLTVKNGQTGCYYSVYDLNILGLILDSVLYGLLLYLIFRPKSRIGMVVGVGIIVIFAVIVLYRPY